MSWLDKKQNNFPKNLDVKRYAVDNLIASDVTGTIATWINTNINYRLLCPPIIVELYTDTAPPNYVYYNLLILYSEY